MPGFCPRWSKTRWTLLTLFFLLLAYCVFPGKRERPPAEGYVGNVFLSFPEGQYTAIVDVREKDGRKIIRDNLWGFTYPEMKPFTNEHTKDFLLLHTPWVRASVHKRNGLGCFKGFINSKLAKRRLDLSWYDLPKPLSEENATMRKLDGKYLGLNKMMVPEDDQNTYQNGLVGPDHFRLKKAKYYGPYEIYWSDDFCTTMVCYRFFDGTSRCTQEHAIESDDIYLSLSYNGALAANREEILRESLRVLDSFRNPLQKNPEKP